VQLSFIPLAIFRVSWDRLGMSDADLQAFEGLILKDPARPPVMAGTGGLRKIRFAKANSAAGKSGGVRVCYALFREHDLVYFCSVFAKSDAANLTAAQKKAYREVLADLSRLLDEHSKRGWTP
jgi:hypothetical protein